eukprot:10192005-Heterocapsa_arctica.AAC.1
MATAAGLRKRQLRAAMWHAPLPIRLDFAHGPVVRVLNTRMGSEGPARPIASLEAKALVCREDVAVWTDDRLLPVRDDANMRERARRILASDDGRARAREVFDAGVHAATSRKSK